MTQADLKAQRSKLESAFSTADVEVLASLLTEQVVWATSAQAPWVGRQQVLDRIGDFFGRHRYLLRFGHSQVDSDEMRAVDRTNFESWVDDRPGTGGEPHRGSAVIVWIREDHWRITAYLDVGTELF